MTANHKAYVVSVHFCLYFQLNIVPNFLNNEMYIYFEYAVSLLLYNMHKHGDKL